jgi:hypothetical protein
MMSLGQMFYEDAARPQGVMMAFFQRKDVASALNVVTYECPENAFNVGVERVRRECRVSREAIVLLLPIAEMSAAALAVGGPQRRMVEVWNQHQNSLTAVIGRIAGALVEVTLGIGGLGLGDQLAAAANNLFQDARLAEPFGELERALNGYEQWLRWAADRLNQDGALVEARAREMRRRRLVKLATAVAVTSMGAVGVAVWARSNSAARDGASPSEVTTSPSASAVVPTAAPSAPSEAVPSASAPVRTARPRATARPASTPAPKPTAVPSGPPKKRALYE